MVDLIFIAVVFVTAAGGWHRGLLAAAISLGGIVVAYVAAYWLYLPAGQALGRLWTLQPLLCSFLGATAVFLGVVMGAWILAAVVLRRRRRLRRTGQRLPITGHIGGALLGAAYGIGLAMAGLSMLLVAEGVTGRSWFDARASMTGRVALPLWERLVRGVARQASGSDRLAQAAGRMARDSAAVTRGLRQVATDPRVHRLVASLGDPGPNGASGADSDRSTALVAELARDARFVRAMRDAGLATVDAEADSAQVQKQVSEQLMPLARLVDRLAHDAEVRRLVADPALAAKLQRRDLLSLANDPKFNQLANRVLAQLRSGGAIGPRGNGQGVEQPSTAAPKRRRSHGQTYRWTGKEGRVHFSDRPPPGNTRHDVVPSEH